MNYASIAFAVLLAAALWPTDVAPEGDEVSPYVLAKGGSGSGGSGQGRGRGRGSDDLFDHRHHRDRHGHHHHHDDHCRDLRHGRILGHDRWHHDGRHRHGNIWHEHTIICDDHGRRRGRR